MLGYILTHLAFLLLALTNGNSLFREYHVFGLLILSLLQIGRRGLGKYDQEIELVFFLLLIIITLRNLIYGVILIETTLLIFSIYWIQNKDVIVERIRDRLSYFEFFILLLAPIFAWDIIAGGFEQERIIMLIISLRLGFLTLGPQEGINENKLYLLIILGTVLWYLRMHFGIFTDIIPGNDLYAMRKLILIVIGPIFGLFVQDMIREYFLKQRLE